MSALGQLVKGSELFERLRELRADKLFLMVSGITLGFGLYHHTFSEVTIKQAMIRSAREVIFAIEPVLEIVELRSAAFREDAKAWFCLSRKRTIPAQPSTQHD